MIFKKDNGGLVLNKPKIVKLTDYGYMLMVDVETSNDDKIIMDFSYNIVNLQTGMVVDYGAFLISETWNTRKFKFGKYMKKKHKKYSSRIKKGTIKVITKQHFYNKLNKILRTYNIQLWCAYNGAFDLEATINTFDYIDKRTKLWKEKCWRKNGLKPLFTRLDLLDLWTYASVIYSTPQFKEWYDMNIKKYTKEGNRKTNVEVITAYLKENGMFKETHIGIEDLENEYNIFMASCWISPNKEVVVNYQGNWGAYKLAQDKPLSIDSKTYQVLILHNLEVK